MLASKTSEQKIKFCPESLSPTVIKVDEKSLEMKCTSDEKESYDRFEKKEEKCY